MKKEKRRHQRYRLFAMAVITVKNDHTRARLTAHIENISQGGMSTVVSSPIKIDTPIIVDMKFTHAMMKRIHSIIEGRVVRVSRLNNLFSLCISFDRELSPERYPQIYEYFSEINRSE